MFRNILIIFIVGVLGRVSPHPPNMTPLTGLCLMAGSYLPLRLGTCALLLSYFFADLSLSYINNFPLIGSWSFYTYTGTIGLLLFGAIIRGTKFPMILSAPIASFCFWAWTNLGVWVHSGIYLNTKEGLILCYTAAVPFLQKTLIGDLLWVTILSLLLPPIFSRVSEYNTQEISKNSNFEKNKLRFQLK